MMKRLLYPFWKPNWIKSIHFRKYPPDIIRWIDEQVKSGEIARRIKLTEKDIDQVVKQLNNDTEPPEETFLILEEEVYFVVYASLT